MDIPQQITDTINQVTDKSVREALLLMVNSLVSGRSELVEKMSNLQTFCYNLNVRLTSVDSSLIKNPPFDLREYSGDFHKMKK